MIDSLEHVLKRWDETHDAIVDWLAQFPEERLTWSPGGAATSAGGILAHISRANHVYASMALGEAIDRPVFHVTNREQAEQVIAKGDAAVRRALETLCEEDLSVVRADDWGPLGPLVSGPLDSLWFLEQMIRHSAYHLGQLWYLSLLLEDSGD